VWVVLVRGVVGNVGRDVGGRLVAVRVPAAHIRVVRVQRPTVGFRACNIVTVGQNLPNAATHVLLVVETAHRNGNSALDGMRRPILLL